MQRCNFFPDHRQRYGAMAALGIGIIGGVSTSAASMCLTTYTDKPKTSTGEETPAVCKPFIRETLQTTGISRERCLQTHINSTTLHTSLKWNLV